MKSAPDFPIRQLPVNAFLFVTFMRGMVTSGWAVIADPRSQVSATEPLRVVHGGSVSAIVIGGMKRVNRLGSASVSVGEATSLAANQRLK